MWRKKKEMRTSEKLLRFGGAAVLAMGMIECGNSGTTMMDMAKPADMAKSPAPSITMVTPATSANTGGGMLTITGTNFQTGATATVGAATCANPLVMPTQITCSLPAKAAVCGAQDVVVTNPDSQTATKTGAVRYLTSAVTFATPTTAATGMLPRRDIAADFNADGKLDIAASNNNSGTVSVLIGNGDGTFKTALSLTAAGVVQDVGAGDVNGDMKMDIVASNNAMIYVFLGNGDGTFQTAKTFSAGVTNPAALALGDLNGDMKLDVVYGSQVTANAGIALGNGDGTFKTPTVQPTAGNVLDIELGDIDGDKKLDLLTTSGNTAQLQVFIGNGDGTFKAAANSATGTTPASIAIGDVNGDGKVDVFVGNAGGSSVSVFVNAGTALPATATATPMIGGGMNPETIAAADVNGDGFVDIVTCNPAANKWSYLPGMANNMWGAAVNTATVSQPNGIMIADLNGDKQPDVVATNGNNAQLQIFLQQCQ